MGVVRLARDCDPHVGHDRGAARRLDRLDLPLLLGTMATENCDRADCRIRHHLVIGEDSRWLHRPGSPSSTATWWLAVRPGVAVALTIVRSCRSAPRMASNFAGPASDAVIEPPGLLGLNYGVETPAVAIVAHLVFGIALGLLLTAH